MEKLNKTFMDLAKALAARYRALKIVAREFESDLQVLKGKYTPRLLRLSEEVSQTERALKAVIRSNSELFERPKTRTLLGVKFGLRKQKGTIEIQDTDKTIRLIEKHMPERLDELAPMKRALSKKALERLEVAELKRIGAVVTKATDEPVVKAEDSEAEKIIEQAFKDLGASVKEAA